MTKCLKQGEKVEHTKELIECFETCRNTLTSEPVVSYPHFEKDFEFTTDTSGQTFHMLCIANIETCRSKLFHD